MPRSACVPSGISGAPVSAATRARNQDRPVERPAQSLQPADQVDGRTDRGEIQPVGRADIAPQDLADMHGRAEPQGRQALRLPRCVEMRHSGPGGRDRAERRVAGGAGRAFGNRKDRQHAVADEFQHFAAEGMHGAGDAVEPGVESGDHRRGGCGLGQGGETAQIGA